MAESMALEIEALITRVLEGRIAPERALKTTQSKTAEITGYIGIHYSDELTLPSLGGRFLHKPLLPEPNISSRNRIQSN